MVKSSSYSTNCTVKSSPCSTHRHCPHRLVVQLLLTMRTVRNSLLPTTLTLKSALLLTIFTSALRCFPLNVQEAGECCWLGGEDVAVVADAASKDSEGTYQHSHLYAGSPFGFFDTLTKWEKLYMPGFSPDGYVKYDSPETTISTPSGNSKCIKGSSSIQGSSYSLDLVPSANTVSVYRKESLSAHRNTPFLFSHNLSCAKENMGIKQTIIHTNLFILIINCKNQAMLLLWFYLLC